MTDIPAVSTAAWVFADRPQPKAEAGAIDEPTRSAARPRAGDIDQHDYDRRSALHKSAREPAHRRTISAPGSVSDLKRASPDSNCRRAAALMEPGLAQDSAVRAGGEEIDGDAGNDLVAALGDGGKAVNQRQITARKPGSRPEARASGRAGDTRRGAGGERRAEHLAFQADVENAGAFGKQSGQCTAKQQRYVDPDGRFGGIAR